MTDRARQLLRYWLTPTGCVATGGHQFTGGVCWVCGSHDRDEDDS